MAKMPVKQTKNGLMNPLRSIFMSTYNGLINNKHFPKKYDGMECKMHDDVLYKIQKHVVIGNLDELKSEKGVLMIIRFKPQEINKNTFYQSSLIPGVADFRAKFWINSQKNGFKAGIYQWKSLTAALDYIGSFVMNNIKNNSVPGSVKYEIIPGENIYDYISGRI